jgi:hypothetical protein
MDNIFVVVVAVKYVIEFNATKYNIFFGGYLEGKVFVSV